MSPLYFDNAKGGLTSRDGKLLECCCCDACHCPGSIYIGGLTNPYIIVTLGNNASIKIYYYQFYKFIYDPFTQVPTTTLVCEKCEYVNIVQTGTCQVTLYWTITNPENCDCESIETCNLQVVRWENEPGCPAGASVINVTMGEDP
jgi:hypothetical protein